MKPLRASLATSAPILTTHDFNKIFFKVEELFKIHDKFFSDLELRVSNWNIRQIIGDLFLSLVSGYCLGDRVAGSICNLMIINIYWICMYFNTYCQYIGSSLSVQMS